MVDSFKHIEKDTREIADSTTERDCFRSLSLKTRFRLGFGGLILVIAASIGFILLKLASVESDAASVIEHRQPVAIKILSFSENLNLASSLLYGYLLSGDSEHKQQFLQLKFALDNEIEAIAQLQRQGEVSIPQAQINVMSELYSHFVEFSQTLFTYKENNEINFPGLNLVSNLLNTPALEYAGLVAELLNEDLGLNSPNDKEVRRLLNEMRYTWSQMMNSLRVYLLQGNARDIDNDNFKNYAEVNWAAYEKLKKMKVNIGFDAIKELGRIWQTYMDGVPIVVNYRLEGAWRLDIHIMKTEVDPIVTQLQNLMRTLADNQILASKNSGKKLTASLEQIRFTTILLLVFATIVGLLLSISITSAVIPPVQKMITAAKRIASGDLTTQINISSGGEIGQLSHSFNAMVSDLRFAADQKEQFLNELQTLNHTLEHRVHKRTYELQEKEARIRSILDTICEGILVIDAKGTVESINPAGELIFALSQQQAIGMDSFDLLAPGQNHAGSNTNESSPNDRNPLVYAKSKLPMELQGKKSDNDYIPLELVISDISLSKENKRVCIIRDISERKETNRRLQEAQKQLLEAAHKSGMAEIATGVLHNIGNILNSVNVSVEQLNRVARQSKISGILKANQLLQDNIDSIGEFLTHNAKGKKLPEYYIKIGNVVKDEMAIILTEAKVLEEKTNMMKEVIGTQQSYAQSGFFTETFSILPLIEDALKVEKASLHKWGVKIIKEIELTPDVLSQKSKLLQVVTNLIKNAKEAMIENDIHNKSKELIIRTGRYKDKSVFISISDNGCGISKENLANVFSHGFTTKEHGHGFGLHTSANSLTEMGGSLIVHSDGIQQGACFTLSLPISDEHAIETQTNKVVNS